MQLCQLMLILILKTVQILQIQVRVHLVGEKINISTKAINKICSSTAQHSVANLFQPIVDTLHMQVINNILADDEDEKLTSLPSCDKK